MNAADSRLRNIDSLRGISALLVVWHHMSEQFVLVSGVQSQGSFLAEIANNYDFGRIGIVCFFLISGFVIPNSLDAGHPKPLKKFAVRRFYRLYPAFWLSLIVMTFIMYLWHQPPAFTTFLANITMLQSFFAEPHIIGLYWTLGVELVFYIICALLFYFNVLNQTKTLLLGIIIGLCMFVLLQVYVRGFANPIPISKEFQLFPYLLAIMFLGAIFRKAYDNNSSRIQTSVILGTLFCFAPPLVLWTLSGFNINLFEDQFRFGTGHFFALILFVLGLKTLKKSPAFMVGLGTISYSVYLFHPVVMKLMQKFLIHSETQSPHPLHIYLLTGASLTIALAFVIYTLLEKPMIQLGYKKSQK